MRQRSLYPLRPAIQSRGVLHLDLPAIYAAVSAVQKGIVKVIASRCGRKPVTFYRQQEREVGETEPQWRPYLLFQIVKQQVALETKPREEACAELICEAEHLGARVVWEDEVDEGHLGILEALGRLLGRAADVVACARESAADGAIHPDELAEIKRQCRSLREAADLVEQAAEARVLTVDGGQP